MALSGAAALAASSVLACGAVPAAATSQDAQIVWDAVTNLALETFSDPGLSQEEMAVISAQAGIAYWYAAVTDASTWTSGHARMFSGYCQDANGNIYFGSASINDDASTMYGDIADSNNNHITVSYTLKDRTNLPYCKTMYPNVGFHASGGQTYTISTSYTYPYPELFDGEISGDPFDGWFAIGSSPFLRDARFKRPDPNNCGMLFYSGGWNLSGTDVEPTGDFLDDFETVQDDLRETYPDVDEDFYINIIIVQPTEPTDPTEETGNCNCTHDITVNVDVTLEGDTLPSQWFDEVEPPSETVETLPVLEDYTLPTFEIDNTTIDGMHFWRDLLDAVVTRSGLVGTVTVILILSIVEWLLWNVGR